jgi:TPR repeat protein
MAGAVLTFTIISNASAGQALVANNVPPIAALGGSPADKETAAQLRNAGPPSLLPARMAASSPAAEALWQRGTPLYDRKDFSGALAVYSQAAGLGHPRAMAVLGNMYRDGQGVPRDPYQAVKWYTRAAALGNRGAQYSLGRMYEEGEGLPRSVTMATQLYKASARQGMPKAQLALGLSYEFGNGVSRNRRSALYWLDQAAKQGDVAAQL